MEKSLQVTVTNPDDLNTLQGELVTQNYNLEILGLKNPADFRKFSKSLMMLDRILKETNYNVDNGLNKKLNKGTYEGDADDLKREIDGKEPSFSKNTGFNKEKTDNYNENDTNKLFTQEGAYNLNKELQQNINNKIGFIKYLDGINSPEELYALAPGIYKLRNKPIFGLGEGWWTVTKVFSGSADDGDQIVKVNHSAGEGHYYQGGFNSGRWTNWHKFNACPYEVGDIYVTSRKENPAELWLNTAWEKVRGRFLYATSNDENTNVLATGGNSTVTLTKNNLPNVKIQVEPFSLSRGSMNITGRLGSPTTEGSNFGEGAFSINLHTGGRSAGSGGNAAKWNFDASRAWTGTTSTASPYTQSLGNSTPIDIMPPYISVHVWRRVK